MATPSILTQIDIDPVPTLNQLGPTPPPTTGAGDSTYHDALQRSLKDAAPASDEQSANRTSTDTNQNRTETTSRDSSTRYDQSDTKRAPITKSSDVAGTDEELSTDVEQPTNEPTIGDRVEVAATEGSPPADLTYVQLTSDVGVAPEDVVAGETLQAIENLQRELEITLRGETDHSGEIPKPPSELFETTVDVGDHRVPEDLVTGAGDTETGRIEAGATGIGPAAEVDIVGLESTTETDGVGGTLESALRLVGVDVQDEASAVVPDEATSNSSSTTESNETASLQSEIHTGQTSRATESTEAESLKSTNLAAQASDSTENLSSRFDAATLGDGEDDSADEPIILPFHQDGADDQSADDDNAKPETKQEGGPATDSSNSIDTETSSQPNSLPTTQSASSPDDTLETARRAGDGQPSDAGPTESFIAGGEALFVNQTSNAAATSGETSDVEFQPTSSVDRVANVETVATSSDVAVPGSVSSGSSSSPSVASAQPPSGSTGTPDTTFVDRVSEATQLATQTGRPLRVRLSPPELGSMQIEVAVRNGVMTARLEVQTPAAQQTMLEQISSLREALAQNGSTIDRIEVVLDESGYEGAPTGFDDQQQEQDDPNERQEAEGQDEEGESSEDDENTETGSATDRIADTGHIDQLDIEV
jgi:flagellar hook-length control protein FliK